MIPLLMGDSYLHALLCVSCTYPRDCSIVNIKDFGNDEVVTTTAQTLDELAVCAAFLM